MYMIMRNRCLIIYCVIWFSYAISVYQQALRYHSEDEMYLTTLMHRKAV